MITVTSLSFSQEDDRRVVVSADDLLDIHGLLNGYVDADHNGHCFIPNDAMRAQMRINEILGVTIDD